MTVHQPVMVAEVVRLLITDPSGLYVDGTLGGGGHALAIAGALNDAGRVIGVDRDPEAVERARARAGSTDARLELVHARASQLQAVLAVRGLEKVDGVLLDLGLSSDQLASGRGFGFSSNGTLDLRFDPEEATPPAHELLRALSAADLADALKRFGDFSPRDARRLGRAAVEHLAGGEDGVAALVRALEPLIPARRRAQTLARIFQAIRILVNDELDELDRSLASARDVLRPGGVLCVISYHSLEDRRVKRFITPPSLPVPELPPPDDWPAPAFEPLARRALRSSPEEIAINPRARSARLRAARRRDT